MTPPTAALDSGFRTAGTFHDIDERRHRAVVEFPHDVLDTYDTSFSPDCFRESFARKLPVMLREHDKHKLIGHAVSAEALRHANRIVGQFSDFDAVPLAKQTFAQIRDGDLPGWSFQFKNASHVPHPTVRSAKRYVRGDMPEFSAVAFPSIPGTRTVDIRSASATVERATLADLQLALDVAEQDLAEVRRLRDPGASRLQSLERAKRTSSALRAEIHAHVAPGAAGRRSQRSPAQLRLIAGALDRLNHRSTTGK